MAAPPSTPTAPRVNEDVVAERTRLIEIGMTAVFGACAVFAVLRLAIELSTGLATPWWGNAVGVVLIGLLYLWFRGDPPARTAFAGHATAAISTIALIIPAAYGMPSSKWWLSLVAFAMMLMGRRREAVVWSVIIAVLVAVVALAEPHIAVANALGESPPERALAGLAYVAILLGITWAFRREADRRARQLAETADSLERANRVRSRFLANMSHELRTPLHGVVAMTDLARKGDASEDVREQITTAQESALVLLGLLNNVLDVTRAEAGAIELDARPFALDVLFTQVARPQAALAKARGVPLTATAEPGVIARRVGDRVRVGQILLNLVTNAIKFTSEGEVTVRVKRGPQPDRIVFEVRDTGRGIPKDQLEAIFLPFTQAHRGDSELSGGAGLGLAIVRELSKQMDGSVRVQSEVGKGSTFTVELRLPPAPGSTETLGEQLLGTRSSDLPPPSHEKTESLSIVACDDDPLGRRILSMLLSRMGHTAVVAESGRAAWELLATRSFDLLLTDIEMPGMDGLELTRRVREEEQRLNKARLPILAATAHVGPEEQHRLLAAGIDVHVPKPFTESELQSAIEKARTHLGPGALTRG